MQMSNPYLTRRTSAAIVARVDPVVYGKVSHKVYPSSKSKTMPKMVSYR